jgi:hypothetical protein
MGRLQRAALPLLILNFLLQATSYRTTSRMPRTNRPALYATSTVAEAEEEDFMDVVDGAVRRVAPVIVSGLSASGQGWAVCDNFLGSSWSSRLRGEAVGLYENKAFVKSQSTRFDPVSRSKVYYDKHNVFSTQLNGGEAYFQSPRLHEYVVAMTRAVVPSLTAAFPSAHVSNKLVSNKLAVCVGDGSAYDKHYDNSGLDDLRKVTVLYYLNDWRPELGGEFRIFGATDNDTTDIAPQGDRLLVFWSDVLVHSVLPSMAPRGKADHRYALTVWLTCEAAEHVVRDNTEVALHFGTPS